MFSAARQFKENCKIVGAYIEKNHYGEEIVITNRFAIKEGATWTAPIWYRGATNCVCKEIKKQCREIGKALKEDISVTITQDGVYYRHIKPSNTVNVLNV